MIANPGFRTRMREGRQKKGIGEPPMTRAPRRRTTRPVVENLEGRALLSGLSHHLPPQVGAAALVILGGT